MLQSSNSGMKQYYTERAPVYDRIYDYPERQEDFRFMENYIPEQLKGLDVIEIAAGTGYWSQFIVQQTKTLLATDASIETLRELEKKDLTNNIATKVTDAYSLKEINGSFNGAFAGLWLSHIPKKRLTDFLGSLHQKLSPGAKVVFMDNTNAQCDRLPLAHTDAEGNTYQDRALDNGTMYRIIKNFLSEVELTEAIEGFGINPKYTLLEHFWIFEYDAV